MNLAYLFQTINMNRLVCIRGYFVCMILSAYHVSLFPYGNLRRLLRMGDGNTKSEMSFL